MFKRLIYSICVIVVTILSFTIITPFLVWAITGYSWFMIFEDLDELFL